MHPSKPYYLGMTKISMGLPMHFIEFEFLLVNHCSVNHFSSWRQALIFHDLHGIQLFTFFLLFQLRTLFFFHCIKEITNALSFIKENE